MDEPYKFFNCRILLYLVFCSSVILYQKSVKSHLVNNLGFAGHTVFVKISQFLSSNAKAAINNSKQISMAIKTIYRD